MALNKLRRRMIINADDFGASTAINQAVVGAHQEGILTTASLMVNGDAFQEAVSMARHHPTLGVGLHLTLVMGRSTLPAEDIPGLVNASRQFSNSPVAAGMIYFFRPALKQELRREIRAQFSKFKETGLALDHVNGHLNMHLHPVVFSILMEEAASLGISRFRWTRDPFWLNARLDSGRWGYRTLHAMIYRALTAVAKDRLQKKGIRHADRVFGLLQNARVDEQFLSKLISNLPPGDSEIYSHPSLDLFKHEYEALISSKVSEQVQKNGIQLIRYQDL